MPALFRVAQALLLTGLLACSSFDPDDRYGCDPGRGDEDCADGYWCDPSSGVCLVGAAPVAVQRCREVSNRDAPGHVVYRSSADHRLYRVPAYHPDDPREPTPVDVTACLDAHHAPPPLPAGALVDEWVAASGDGEWLLLATRRFDDGCQDKACLTLIELGVLMDYQRCLDEPHVCYDTLRVDGQPVYPAGMGDIAEGGELVVVSIRPEAAVDEQLVHVIGRVEEGWAFQGGAPPLEGHPVFAHPRVHAPTDRVVFECVEGSGADARADLCQWRLGEPHTELLWSRHDRPRDFDASPAGGARISHPDFLGDGRIVFAADWGGRSHLWVTGEPGVPPEPIPALEGPEAPQDSLPCGLPDNRIAFGSAPSSGSPLLQVISFEGDGQRATIGSGLPVADVGLGCSP